MIELSTVSPVQCPECNDTGLVPHPQRHYYIVGPEFEARALGRWPSQGTYGVWSKRAWRACLVRRPLKYPLKCWPEIGCDVARFGDDFTAIHARWNCTSLHHERHNGWGTHQTKARLMELAAELAEYAAKEAKVPCTTADIRIKVDDTGVGGGVVDGLREHNAFSQVEYQVYGVAAAGRPNDPGGYLNVRSELWFTLADSALKGLVDLSRLDAETLKVIERQFMAPVWKLQGTCRVVEPKDATKKRLGHSPDDADAVNLAWYKALPIGGGVEGVNINRREQ